MLAVGAADPWLVYPTAAGLGAIITTLCVFVIRLMRQSNADRKTQQEVIKAQNARIEEVETNRVRDQKECNARIDDLNQRSHRRESQINMLVGIINRMGGDVPEQFWNDPQ